MLIKYAPSINTSVQVS